MPGATLEEHQTIFDMDIRDYHKVTDLNLTGTVYPSLVFAEAMAKQGEGSIITVSSMATYSAITRVLGYSVAKTGVNIFTQWLAMETATEKKERAEEEGSVWGVKVKEREGKEREEIKG